MAYKRPDGYYKERYRANPEEGRRRSKKWREANRERHLEVKRNYRRRHAERLATEEQERNLREPQKRKARDMVNARVRRGTMSKGPCERESDDCLGPIQAHHDDYSKPLDVRWLCARHHCEEK